MFPFCTDSDLIVWEPELLRQAAWMSQTLISGNGDLSNTTFTTAAGSFIASHVLPDHVMVLDGSITGCFPIISVDSATTMTISILYEGIWHDGGGKIPSRVGSAVSLNYAVRTFYAQRRIVGEMLLASVGQSGADPATEASRILNPEALRNANTLGTLHMIHSTLAAVADKAAQTLHQTRADLYRDLYRKELNRLTVLLDLDNDARLDTIRRPDRLQLRRE